MKLTETQIKQIDAALIKAGINYADIRAELTDHIATDLEKEDDRFAHHLKGWIVFKKPELKRLYRKFLWIAAGRSLRALAANAVKPWFWLCFTALLAAGKFVGAQLEREDALWYYILAFEFCTAVGSLPTLYTVLIKRQSYSVTHGLGFVPALLMFPGIWAMRWLEGIENLDVILLFYTVLCTTGIAVFVTARRLLANYKLRYTT